MNKYIVINSEDIQKRIDELKIKLKEELDSCSPIPQIIGEYKTELNTLKQILSNSKLLTPIIKDAFEAGELLGKGFKVKTKQDYINNLKLDI